MKTCDILCNPVTSVELLFTNLLLGLISSFSPCLFPLLPMYLATQLKLKQSKFMSVLSSLSLILGILVVFLSIGLLVDQIGGFLTSNYAIFARIQGSLLILAGLILIRKPGFMDKIKLPSRIENFIYAEDSHKNSLIFSFVLGLVYTIIAAPCAGGIFIAIWLGMVGEVILNQFLLGLFFALGAGIPFLILSLFMDDIRAETVGKIHSTSNVITIILGVIFVIVGMWLVLDTTTVL